MSPHTKPQPKRAAAPLEPEALASDAALAMASEMERAR